MPNHTTNKVFLCCIQARCTTGKQLDVEEDFYTNVFPLAYEYECHTHTNIHTYNNKGKAINAT